MFLTSYFSVVLPVSRKILPCSILPVHVEILLLPETPLPDRAIAILFLPLATATMTISKAMLTSLMTIPAREGLRRNPISLAHLLILILNHRTRRCIESQFGPSILALFYDIYLSSGRSALKEYEYILVRNSISTCFLSHPFRWRCSEETFQMHEHRQLLVGKDSIPSYGSIWNVIRKESLQKKLTILTSYAFFTF